MDRRALILSFAACALAGCGDSMSPSDMASPGDRPDPSVDQTVIPATCSDGKQNQDETDADCGGSCDPCADGRKCGGDKDCQAGHCEAGTCGKAPCANGMKDGKETDTDCGGGICSACTVGQMCGVLTDCDSMRCCKGTCQLAVNCTFGTEDCDCDPKNGCEVKLLSDVMNCGKCGTVCPMNMPQCYQGTCQAKPSVLVVAGDSEENYGRALVADLMATGVFASVDFHSGSNSPPSSQKLATYTVVLVYETSFFNMPAVLGDNLATYYDAGGRVVLAPLANSAFDNTAIAGRFADPANGYVLIDPAGVERVGADSLGKINEPMSPLLDGVKTFTMGSPSRSKGGPINGGVVVAAWKSGAPLLVRGVVKGRKRVDLNFVPLPARDFGAQGWAGDGMAILTNALLYM